LRREESTLRKREDNCDERKTTIRGREWEEDQKRDNIKEYFHGDNTSYMILGAGLVC
jgi:hypothetical protein